MCLILHIILEYVILRTSPPHTCTGSEFLQSPLHEIKTQIDCCTGLKLGHVNACSLYPKIDEIQFILITLDLDILCISETWLHDQIKDQIISVEGYDVLRKDRLKKKRRRCLYIYQKIIKCH